MLALIRNIPAAFSNVLDGHWQRDPYKGSELHEKTVGLVGYGRIGTLVAKYLHAFDCNILATDPFVQSAPDVPYVQFVDLDHLLQESDIVSLHVSLTDETNRFFGLNQFSLMKKGSLFINTSRGELIDESALLHVLGIGHLAGAALDVLCDEHLFEGNLNDLMLYSRQYNNLLITPHIAGCTSESMEKTEVFMAEKLFRAIGKEGA
jgi:D-3-phosphoglycerate dehydrogenase